MSRLSHVGSASHRVGKCSATEPRPSPVCFTFNQMSVRFIVGGYSADHPVIKIFWRVVEGFTDEEKRKLLKFVTSCSRPPLLGFKVHNLRALLCAEFPGLECAQHQPAAMAAHVVLEWPRDDPASSWSSCVDKQEPRGSSGSGAVLSMTGRKRPDPRSRVPRVA